MSGSFSNNSIGAPSVAGSGGEGLLVGSLVDGVSHTTSILANGIRNYTLVGIDLIAGGAARLDATVGANVFEDPSPTAQHGFRATAGNTPTSTALVCLSLTNNLLMDAGPVSDFRLVQGGLATMRLPSYAGAKDDNDAVAAFVAAAQALNMATGIVSNTVASGGGGFIGGALCN
jgi:hypothetical protein